MPRILDARALYPDSSLADLYDELTMPVELRRAHQDNDRTVMATYGFPIKTMTESQCVAIAEGARNPELPEVANSERVREIAERYNQGRDERESVVTDSL